MHIPPKIKVQEIEGGGGTRIVYDSASSTMVVDDDEELRKAAAALDEKLEGLARRVLSQTQL